MMMLQTLEFSEANEARRFVNHFLTKGYWFQHERKKGQTVVKIANSHDLTALSRKFRFRAMLFEEPVE